MNEKNLEQDLSGLISSACAGLVDNFTRLNGLLVEPHSEMEPRDIAMNLMEFGRGHFSGTEKPSDSDHEFMVEYVGSLEVPGELAHRFCAYVSGCVLGWVVAGELPRKDLPQALAVVQSRAVELFPKGEEQSTDTDGDEKQ